MIKKNTKTIFISSVISLLILGLFFVFSTSVAHAADETIYDGLSGSNPDTTWIPEVWNIMLGLSNSFVAVILLFFAFVNVAHIQYDTYQLKKTLPKLILGIIMANASMIICKIMLGVSNVLTVTFLGPRSSKDLADSIMQAVCFSPTSTSFGSGLLQAGGMLLALVFGLIILIGIMAVAFLVWIRRTVLYLLAAVSPIAFILLAFPPTESYFKSWWEWEIKWTFMGSISVFLIWMAGRIGANQCGGAIAKGEGPFQFSLLLAVCGLLVLAAIVPFKLGGAVMGAWGGLAKTAGKAAWDNPYSQRKRELAKAKMGDRFGKSGLGKLLNRNKVGDEMRLQQFKDRQANRDTDAKTKIMGGKHGAGFQETKHETAMANSQLETQEAITMDVILNGNAGARAAEMAAEKLRNLNAKNDVEKTNTNAETKARSDAGHKQNLRERELAHAKNILEEQKITRDEDINEGILGNMTQAEIEEITGLKGPEATGMHVKSRYLEQNNKLNTQKLRAEKRAGQDAQALAQRDLRQNDELRQTMSELAENGEAITTTLDMATGQTLALGASQDITYIEARETAERLRYAATTAEGPEKIRLEQASAQFKSMADKYEADLSTNKAVIASRLTAQEAHHNAAAISAAADPTTTAAATAAATAAEAEYDVANPGTIGTPGHAAAKAAAGMAASDKVIADAQAPHLARAATARKLAANIAAGNAANFTHYLSNNLAGRRQKIINPDISDEVQTQVKSTPSGDLYGDILNPNKTVGTGEARIGQAGMFKVLNGKMNEVSEAEARAGLVQVGAMHQVMTTARHGDVTGLNQMDGFFDVMNAAGRTNFKTAAVNKAYDSMDEESRIHIQEAAMKQAGVAVPAGSSQADIAAQWARLPAADRQSHLSNIKFERLNTKGGGPGPSALGNFVDRTLGQVEADKGLGLGSSSGSKAARTREVNSGGFIENSGTMPTP